MEEVKEAVVEETEVEKASRILKEAEEAKSKEFSEKLNALLEEYGYVLDVVSQITLKKK